MTKRAAATPPPPSDATKSALRIDGVTVHFPSKRGPGRTVFDNLCFEVNAGELTCVVGKSGGGKTTLLHLLVGMVKPTRGTVDVLGTDPVSARNRIGLMLARDALIPSRSAIRNIEFGLELRGVPRGERHAIARNYLQMMELEHAANLWPWQLSQGMRQRVALARTWAMRPEVLLLDEPFAALDAQTRERMQNEFLRTWAADRRTAVFVTHDLDEAVVLGDRVVVVGDGRVMADLTIPLARPRDRFSVMDDPECRAVTRELHRHIVTT
jgi:NitT/TauT family transport system ATP-binding protein